MKMAEINIVEILKRKIEFLPVAIKSDDEQDRSTAEWGGVNKALEQLKTKFEENPELTEEDFKLWISEIIMNTAKLIEEFQGKQFYPEKPDQISELVGQFDGLLEFLTMYSQAEALMMLDDVDKYLKGLDTAEAESVTAGAFQVNIKDCQTCTDENCMIYKLTQKRKAEAKKVENDEEPDQAPQKEDKGAECYPL